MFNISIYGGGRLCQSFLSGLKQKTDVAIRLWNRDRNKIRRLKNIYSNLQVVKNPIELIHSKSIIFMMVPAQIILDLEKEFINNILETNSILVSCANGLSLKLLNKKYKQIKIIRILPNINWQIIQGITLLQENKHVKASDLSEFKKILRLVSEIYQVKNEDEFDTLGTLTTCGPGIITQLFLELTNAFHIKNSTQFKYFIKASQGTLMLLSKTNPKTIINEVAIKGGLTETGMNAIKNVFPACARFINQEMKAKIDQRKADLK